MKAKQGASAIALGTGLVIISSIFYGSYGVWSKLLGEDFGSFAQAAIRCSIVVACLLPLAIWRKQLAKLHWRRDAKWLWMFALSALFISGPLYYATLQLGVGLAITLAYAGIVLSLFWFGWLFNGERFTTTKAIATLFGLVGLWLIFSPTIEDLGLLPLLAALGSGVATGLNMSASKNIPYSTSQTAIITWTFGVLVNVVAAIMLHDAIPALTWDIKWLYMLLFALTGLVASWTVIKGVKLIDAGLAGILGLLEVVVGVAFGVVLFGERPGPIVLLGVASILLAAAVPYLSNAGKKRAV